MLCYILHLPPLTSVFFQHLQVKLSKPENEQIHEEYDNEYEQYGNEYADYILDKQGKVFKDVKNDSNGDKNADGNVNEENVYERYDGDYEAYHPKYAYYSKSPETHREILLRLAKKKWVILLVISLFAIVGIAVGLSVHFTVPESLPTTTLEPSSTLSIAPTASSMITSTTTSQGISTTVPTTTTTVPTTTTTVPATTTSLTGNAVLLLSTWNSNNKPMIVDFEG